MSTSGGSGKATTSGLIFCMDADNPSSYLGEPATNLIATYSAGSVNALPSHGNQWGTYHVELYNGAAYFSVPVSAVSSNIVTTTSSHPFRTYSVVRPQTTGGGLTAGTDYFIRKIDSTHFSVHTYDSTECRGFAPHSPVTTDTRVSINSTSFPTSWWGPPHMPNSLHVKEIIPNGFDVDGVVHDCMRIHDFRPDDIDTSLGSDLHGMAYGVTPTLTNGVTYTFSCWHRAATNGGIGAGVSWQYYCNGQNESTTITLGRTWQKFTYTWASTQSALCYFYFLRNSGSPFSYDVANIQIEANSHATQFTTAGRSTTTCLLNIAGTDTLTAVSSPFNSSALLYFSGTNSVTGNVTLGTVMSVEMWVNSSSYGGKIPLSINGDSYASGPNIYFTSNIIAWNTGDGATNAFSNSSYPSANVWHHIVVTNNGTGAGNATLYVDGVQIGTATGLTTTTTGSGKLCIGDFHGGSYGIAAYINLVRVYNKVLSADEVYQNFNSTRRRYGV